MLEEYVGGYMRLLGTYTFEKLRQAFQGLFGFDTITVDGKTVSYRVELSQITLEFFPHKYVLIHLTIKDGKSECIGKIGLS